MEAMAESKTQEWIRVAGLSKTEGGVSLSDFSCSFSKGGVHGILGPSGAGKSLLLNLLSGSLEPEGGQIMMRGTVFSADPAMKAKIGYVPKDPVFYSNMTVLEILDFMGQARGVAADKRYRQIKEAMELTGVEEIQNRLSARLNKEERKRVSYAGALLGNPDVLYIDEPIPVKDAAKRGEFSNLIAMLGKVKTVILASSDFSVVRSLCEDTLIMADGRLLVQDRFEALEEKLLRSRSLRVTTKGQKEAMTAEIRALPDVLDCTAEATRGGELRLSVEYHADRDIRESLSRLLGEMGAPILSMTVETLSLESVYRSLTAANGMRGSEGSSLLPEKQEVAE